jgi:hypothetical protein
MRQTDVDEMLPSTPKSSTAMLEGSDMMEERAISQESLPVGRGFARPTSGSRPEAAAWSLAAVKVERPITCTEDDITVQLVRPGFVSGRRARFRSSCRKTGMTLSRSQSVVPR